MAKKATEDEAAHQFLRRLIAIDNRTANIQDSLAWLVKANSPALKAELMAIFGTGKRRAQVYLALNGQRNVSDVAVHLGMQHQNVTIEVKWLRKHHLIDVAEGDEAGNYYTRKLMFDSIVGLSDALMKKFSLGPDGLTNASAKSNS